MHSASALQRVQQGDAGRFTRCGRALARWAARLACLGLGAGVVGCVAEVAPAPVVPADYYFYPYTYYDGHIVYNMYGNWYYPYGNRWYYYRHVPPGLVYRQGAMYQYRPPPSYYRGAPYYRAPYARPPYRVVPYGGGPRR
jgi:hypothetical protein